MSQGRSPSSSGPNSGANSPTRQSSNSNSNNAHAPLVPSRLWQSHSALSPLSNPSNSAEGLGTSYGSFAQSRLDPETSGSSTPQHQFSSSPPQIPLNRGEPTGASRVVDGSQARGELEAGLGGEESDELRGPDSPARDSLLEYAQQHVCGEDNCDHGTFSPRAMTFQSMDDDRGSTRSRDGLSAALGSTVADGLLTGRPQGKRGTTTWLAKTHGVKHRRRMYLTYYFPFAKWIVQYRWAYLKGDFISALTMASFYIPMALSYADNLGHIPPINGLYSFVFNPLIYAFFGTCPQMVVGPEAPGALLVGGVVRSSIEQGHIGDDNGMLNARVAGVVTGMAGAVIFIAGLTRLGFLDSVLSRPFLRGFISAIGVVILADQLIPELGMVEAAKAAGKAHATSWEKLVFLAKNIGKAHPLTSYVSLGAFTIIMVARESKKRFQDKYPSVVFIPDRFVVVVLSAVLTYALRWDQQGLEILGEVKSGSGSPFPFHWPLVPSHMKHIREAMSTSFLIALLGFFESSVAAKSLGGGEKKPGEGIKGVALSANRELVALGIANIVGGCFMALPAFGGYGRSKVNASTGGKTPMSSIFLSLFTILSIYFILPWFYYLPKGVLSAMVSVVAYSLIEECPHDIRFFAKIRGYTELGLMALIFLATIFYSLPLGIALGMGLSLLRVVKHATQPRIQILGKVPGSGTSPDNPPEFANAEEHPSAVEFVEGVLIVKIPEPLTFANTGDLKNRLRRLELYGSAAAHPALPRLRAEEASANVVFDVHGVTSLDPAGAQVLLEIVQSYVERGARVFFSRVPGRRGVGDGRVLGLMLDAGIVECVGGRGHFVGSVGEALRLAGKREDGEIEQGV